MPKRKSEKLPKLYSLTQNELKRAYEDMQKFESVKQYKKGAKNDWQWSDFGNFLDWQWSDFGNFLDWQWSDFGNFLDWQWSDFGDFLDSFEEIYRVTDRQAAKMIKAHV